VNIPREFIDLVLNKVDLVDLINSQIPLRKKSGSNYFARCPFHNEKSASFSVSQPKQFFYCFGCGAHGNAIDFMMQHDRMNFPEAIEALARQVGMEVPHSSAPSTKNDNLAGLYELTVQAADYYYEQMRLSQRAITYLKNRGISGQIAQQFNIGYALPGWNHLLDLLGKNESEKKRLLEAGLIIEKENGGYYDRFRDRIMFPIQDYRGRMIGFGGRILDQGEPKYLNSPETPLFQKGRELYGLYQVLKTQRVVERIMIVEGYMDVIALFQHGITYAVATLGTATTAPHLQRLLRYTADLIFCFDGDQAGKTAAWRAVEVIFPLMQDNLQIRFLFLPDGEDPDSLIRKEGKEAFEKRLLSASSLSAFFFQQMSLQCDMNTMEGRARFASHSLNYIKQLMPGLFRDMILEDLSKRARIDIQTLKQQVKNQQLTKALEMVEIAEEPAKVKLAAPLRLAMSLLLQYPPLASTINEPLPHSNMLGFSFFKQLLEVIEKHPHITTGALREHWRDQKEEAFIAKLASFEHMLPEAGLHNEFKGAIRQLQALVLDEEINRLLTRANQLPLSEEEKIELAAWIAKKKAIL